MLQPNRHKDSKSYRYGFQGQEKDDEIKGEGNSVNYKYRMHDPRLGRFFAVDPLTSKYPFYSAYSFSGNRVVDAFELEGLEPFMPGVYESTRAFREKHMGTAFVEQDDKVITIGLLGTMTIITGGALLPVMEGALGSSLLWASNPGNQALLFEGTAFTSGLVFGDALPEGLFLNSGMDETSKVIRRIAGGLGDDIVKNTSSVLREIRKKINPSGSMANCVDCAINFHRMVAQGANDIIAAPSSGKPTEKIGFYMKEVFGWGNVFDETINHRNKEGIIGLSNNLFHHLENVGQEVVTILGRLKEPRNGITDHVFNAVRDGNGVWKVIDVQNATEPANSFINKTYNNLKVYQAIIDNN